MDSGQFDGITMWHGTATPGFLDGPVPPASQCGWWSRSTWEHHDAWMDGVGDPENRIPYANIIWDQLGLRERGRPNAPEWAKGIRSFKELGETVGMLFVSPDREYVESWYGGPALEIDLSADQVLDVVWDPHIQRRDAYIVLIKAGEPFPVLKPPALSL